MACRLTSEPSTREPPRETGSGIGGKPPTKRRATPLVSVSGAQQKAPRGTAGLVECHNMGPANEGLGTASPPTQRQAAASVAQRSGELASGPNLLWEGMACRSIQTR